MESQERQRNGVRCARNSGLANGIAMVVLGLKPGTEAASTLFHPTEARDTEAEVLCGRT